SATMPMTIATAARPEPDPDPAPLDAPRSFTACPTTSTSASVEPSAKPRVTRHETEDALSTPSISKPYCSKSSGFTAPPDHVITSSFRSTDHPTGDRVVSPNATPDGALTTTLFMSLFFSLAAESVKN